MTRRRVNNGRIAREYRRKTAVERDEARRDRSPQQQLAMLDERLGKGVGAKRERARLKRLIDVSKNKTKRDKPTHKKK